MIFLVRDEEYLGRAMTDAAAKQRIEGGIDIVTMAKEELVFASSAFFAPVTILVDRLNEQVKKIDREARPGKNG